MDYLDTLGENDPLIQAMTKAAGSKSWRDFASKFEELDAEAGAANFLEEPVFNSEKPGADTVIEIERSKTSPKNVGPYVLIRLIGQGGFGRVFEGHHRDSPDLKVAVKVFENRWLDDIERLEIEKLVLQKLKHPNLVTALDAGTGDDGNSFLVMNLVVGTRIDQFVQQQQLGYAEIAKLFLQITEAMKYAHGQDVVHRDLKPNNILITNEKVAVVTDFGLAKRLNLVDEHSLTATGALIGTLGYLAPEQADSNRREVTRSVDIYGLGATLYNVLTGKVPFEREHLLKALEELKTQMPANPSTLNPSVPLDLERICLKCLAKTPRDRYESMQSLADDLQRFIDGRPVLARSPNWRQQLWRWCRTNPLVSGLATSLGLAVMSGLIASTIFWQQAVKHQKVTAALLAEAVKLSQSDDWAAENMLVQTPDTLEFRFQRLLNSVEFLDGLIEQFPEDDILYRESATSQFRLGKVSCRQGKWVEGLEAYQTALNRFRELAQSHPEDHSLQFDVFHSLLGLNLIGDAFLGKAPNEEGKLTEAYETIKQLVDSHPKNTDYRDALICTQTLICYRRFPEDSAEAIDFLKDVYQEAVKLKSEFPEPCLQWRHVGGTAHHLAAGYLNREELEQSEAWLEIAFREIREFLTRPDLDPGEYMDLAECLRLAYILANKKNDFKKADDYARQWRESMSQWNEKYPDYHVFRDELTRSTEYFGNEN